MQGQAFMCVILMALQKCTLGISFFEAKQFVPCMYLEMFFLFPPPQLVNAAVKLAILEQVFFFFFMAVVLGPDLLSYAYSAV